MLDEFLDHFLEGENLRTPVDQRKHDDAEGGLHLRVLVEIVQHNLGVCIALQVDDNPQAVAVGLIADVGDILELLIAHKVGNLFDQAGLVDLIRELRDDDALAVVPSGLDTRLCPDENASPSRRVRFLHAFVAVDNSAGRKIGALNDASSALRSSTSASLMKAMHAVDHFVQIVRRNIRRHADGDAARSVDREGSGTAPEGRTVLSACRRSSA